MEVGFNFLIAGFGGIMSKPSGIVDDFVWVSKGDTPDRVMAEAHTIKGVLVQGDDDRYYIRIRFRRGVILVPTRSISITLQRGFFNKEGGQ